MAPQTFDVNGFRIPVVGLGTFAATDEKELEDALDVALETGYRHIDTANIYHNEHIIGKVLKKWFDSGKLKREDIFVTTKLPVQGVHPDRVERYLKKSLEKLQLDYVDLYLIHFPVCVKEPEEGSTTTTPVFSPEPTDLVSTWKKLEEQVDLGRTTAIGVSNFNKEQLSRIIANARIKPAANQIELHIFLQQPELVKYCQANGIVVISYASFGNPGFNKFLEKLGRPAGPDRSYILGNSVVKQIADKHKKSSAQVTLKFLIQKNIAVIPKSVTAQRIQENFNLFDFTLDAAEIKTLEALDKGEEARLTKWNLTPGVSSHPEYPFPKTPE